ncbi:MAG: glycosyltransferase family 1 protein [bacterium]|nr:glycosyltransferase family 1 protein [bacterium]
MFNIAVDIRSLMGPIRTGVGEYTFEFLNALFKIDKKNNYFLFYNSNKDVSNSIPKWEQDNVEVIKFRYPNKLFNLSIKLFSWPKIDKIMKRKIDYFFSPNINFTALSKDAKQILTIHDLSYEHFKDCFCFKRRLWHRIINPRKQCASADIILTPSANTKQDIVETYKIKENKIHVIYPGLSSVFLEDNKVSPEEIKKKYNLPSKFILFLGTIEPRKNIIGLVKAFEKSFLKSRHYELIIAGSDGWNNDKAKKLIENTENVRYIGYIEEEDKPSIYQLASVFAYPSLYEGFGFPVLEAMVMGTPVLTSNRSSLPEVVGSYAYLVNPNNINDIAEGLVKLATDQELSSYFIEKGRQRVEQFRWKKTAENFLYLLNDK